LLAIRQSELIEKEMHSGEWELLLLESLCFLLRDNVRIGEGTEIYNLHVLQNDKLITFK
jgi:hypothetical protein